MTNLIVAASGIGEVAVPTSSKSTILVRESPPRAPLAFRVGVVGHRPDRLQHADLSVLAGVVRRILSNVKDVVHAMHQDTESPFDDAAPVLRAISPLAEGSDRIFAEQALEVGFELCCVMPFPQTEFEKDFVSPEALEVDSLDRFRKLLNRTSTRFELDGVRTDAAASYATAGRIVLNQSDLLIVIWDGSRQRKRGGTEETFDVARQLGIPVVWIDAHAHHPWQVLDATRSLAQVQGEQRLSPSAGDATAALRECVRAAVELPKLEPHPSGARHGTRLAETEDPKKGLEKFYAEHRPCCAILANVWRIFRDLLGDCKFPTLACRIKPFEEDVLDEWPANRATVIGCIIDSLRPTYAWPDKLAVIYSDRYRSAFIAAFLFAAFAVLMALLPFGARMTPHHLAETICIVAELVAILLILIVVFLGRFSRWHERWIDYRLTAELVRHLRLVAPLGGGRPYPQIPAHLAKYGQPGSTWMAWYVRAVERKLGLPAVAVNKDHLETCLWHLRVVLNGQFRFHFKTAGRCRRIETGLHGFGIVLLSFTLIFCCLHLLPIVWHADFHPLYGTLLTFVGGFFPALGAALAGIANQGEFKRIEKRSESMLQQLKSLRREVARLRKRIADAPEPPLEQLSVPAAALASDAARVLLNEVLDWRVVFLDRPLTPPG